MAAKRAILKVYHSVILHNPSLQSPQECSEVQDAARQSVGLAQIPSIHRHLYIHLHQYQNRQ
jgi:hypothetical protein